MDPARWDNSLEIVFASAQTTQGLLLQQNFAAGTCITAYSKSGLRESRRQGEVEFAELNLSELRALRDFRVRLHSLKTITLTVNTHCQWTKLTLILPDLISRLEISSPQKRW